MILLFISNNFELLSTCYNMNEQTYYIWKASFKKVSQASAIDFELVKIGPYFLKSLCTHCFLVWTLIRYQIFFSNFVRWADWRSSTSGLSQNCLQVSEKSRFFKKTLAIYSWQLWSKTYRSNVSSGNENRPCWMYQV